MTDYTALETRLLAQRKQLERRLNAVERDARHDGESLDDDFAEQAVQRQNDEVLEALDDAGIAELKQINAALKRLENRQYGICVSCGIEIPIARLEALPYADRCIDCAEFDD